MTWNELLDELSFFKKIKSSQNPFFISFGESHRNQELNYKLYDELYKKIKRQLNNESYKMCAEPISGTLKQTNFYTTLQNNAKTYVEYKQSVSSTQFSKCFDEKYKTYVYYSGFHHQLPLARLFPGSFISSPVSSSWDQSIYMQSQSSGLSFSWIDFSILEEYSIKIALKNKPSLISDYEIIFKNILESYQTFMPHLKPVIKYKNNELKDLNLAVISLSIKEHNIQDSNFGGKQYFLISSTSEDMLQTGRLLQKILELPSLSKLGLFNNFINSKSLHYFKYNMNKSMTNSSACTAPGGSSDPISCKSQMFAWTSENQNYYILIWEPEMDTLSCILNSNKVAIENCITSS